MAACPENLYTCPVCFEIYVRPKRLPSCPHVFCESCLLKLQNINKIICPTCRKENTIPDRGVRELLPDLTVTELADAAKIRVHPLKPLVDQIRTMIPTEKQLQTLDKNKKEWEKFRKYNLEQRDTVDSKLLEMIEELKNKRIEILNKFFEYDQHAQHRIASLNEIKAQFKIIEEINKHISAMTEESVTQALVMANENKMLTEKIRHNALEIVPDPLGTVHTFRPELEVKYIGRHITRRKAGEDTAEEVIWSANQGKVYQQTTLNFPTEQIANGKMELKRKKGGEYSLSIRGQKSDPSRFFVWNLKPGQSIISKISSHSLWSMENGNREAKYSTVLENHDERQTFCNEMDHACFTDFPVGCSGHPSDF